MADETTPPEGGTNPPETNETDDQRVPYERFQTANKKAKEAADRAKALEREMSELRASLEERENAGLPELERERAARQKLEQRLQEAEARAQQQEQAMTIATRERWVAAAASKLGFVDPDDASRFLDLTDIEDPKDAERAVKRLAGDKKHLVKAEDPNLPGQVLQNGRPAGPQIAGTAAPGSAFGLIDREQEANAVGQALSNFLAQRKSSGMTFET